jgi:hypothetical protein
VIAALVDVALSLCLGAAVVGMVILIAYIMLEAR